MATNSSNLIGEHFEVDASRPLEAAGGGLVAYAATDRRDRAAQLMAVRVADRETPRAVAVAALTRIAVPSCLGPQALGLAADDRGRTAQFVICAAPPGRSLTEAGMIAGQSEASGQLRYAGQPWGEAELIETLLRPAAAALAALQARHVTHRAIRLDNVFQQARGQPVTLGCAWGSPPASRQPAACEPPYVSVCGPDARGEGTIADDIYALGVLMVALASGTHPLAELDRDAIVARKLRLGSAEAIIGGQRLSPMIADLARGMLADDPEHRPTALMLADPGVAQARRVAARPRRRGQRSIEVGGQTAWDARGLAHALAVEPAKAVLVLCDGTVDQWLRRCLGDVPRALLVESAVRQRATEAVLDDADADAVLLMRAVAGLDPLAPLCWRGLLLWPDAIGPTLAGASPQQEAALIRLIDTQSMAAWALARTQRCDPAVAQSEARRLRALLRRRGWAGGIARLRYASNPLLPCRSRLIEPAMVVRAVDVLLALEQAAERASRPPLPMDAELVAFLAARLEARVDADFSDMGRTTAVQEAALGQLRVLSRLQAKQPSLLVPRVAAWLAAPCSPLIEGASGRSRRAACRAAFDAQVKLGRLPAMLAVLDNLTPSESNDHEAASATAEMARLDATIAETLRQLEVGRLNARRLGREIAAACGIMAAAVVAIMAAL